MGTLHVFLSLVIMDACLGRVVHEKPSVHKNMTKTEIVQTFGVDHHSEVPFYQVADILQHNNLTESKHQKDYLSVKFDAFGKKFHLQLNLNNDFIAKSHLIEFYNANGTVEKYSGFPGQFSSGFVNGDKNSHAAIHVTEKGISGTVRIKKDFFFVNPLPKRTARDGMHIILKKSDLPKDHLFHPLFAPDELKPSKKFSTSKIHERRKRSLQVDKNMEVMIAADYKMVQYYTRDFLPSYMLAVANIMSGLFQDQSLDYKLNVLVVRTVIFEKNEFPAADIGSLLSKFSQWVIKNNVADGIAGHVDNAVLLTRNGCNDGCMLEGLAYTANCMPNAQNVVKDRGLMTALTIAHELAHNLGATHDSSQDCPDGINIMSSGSLSGTDSFKWSTCSSKQIQSILLSPSSSCYNNVPPLHYTNSTFQLYGQVYNADKQCQYAFDSSYRSCSYFQSHCDKLYCQQPGADNCKVLAYPPVHGTYCGANKWCIFGVCVPDGSIPALPIDGQWGSWGSYSPCSHDCGIAVQWRSRTCDNPKPSNGGLNCIGESKGQYKTCNKQDCLVPPSVRLKQCRGFGSEYIDYILNGEQPCKLICTTTSSAYYFGNVEDGAKCFPGSDSNDVCIDGICKSLGCDKELDSDKYFDRCDVCNGDGSSCELVSGNNFETYPSADIYPITEIPEGSFGVRVKEVGETLNFLGFMVGDETNLAISLPAYSAEYNLNGTIVYYDMRSWYFPDEIRIDDKTPIKIKIFLVNFYDLPSEGVTWKYFRSSASISKAPVLAWKGLPWDDCSKSCSGGRQTRKVTCIRKDDDSIVNRELCSSLEPSITSQSCNNQNCPPEWFVTSWSECSKSCGNGTWTRQLFCSMMTITGQVVLPDSSCGTSRPIMELATECNAIMCPALWRSTPWSQCSKSCGGGLKTRKVTCERINSDGSVTVAPVLECSYLVPVSSSEQCNTDIQCPEWKLDFTPCSKSCGGGTKTPLLFCYSPSMENLLDSNCNTSTKPTINLSAQKCNDEPCDYNNWVVIKSQCSVTCGKGLLSLHLECQNNATGVAVTESSCPEKQPIIPVSEECEIGVCPETFKWEITYAGCSVSCGGGLILSKLVCLAVSSKAAAPDIYCDIAKKPSLPLETCNEVPCPTTYIWEASYGSCSVTCSKGVQVPIILCKRETDMVVVNASLCDLKKQSTLNLRPCDMGECPPNYSWLMKYSQCSVTCGTGNETAYSVCVRSSDQVEFDYSMCNSTLKPDEFVRTCNLDECITLQHYWEATYGDCVATCGEGFKLKMLRCIERSTGFVLPLSECTGDPIPVDEVCQKAPCKPAFETTVMPPSYSVGCYNDIPNPRRVPIFLESYRNQYKKINATYFIQQCAINAYLRGYEYYSLQFNGECWAGDEGVASTYYLNGVSHNCQDGVGDAGSNFVYRIGAPIVTKALPPVVMLGCYSDDLVFPRPLPTLLDNFKNDVNWDLLNTDEILKLCALSTNRRGWSLFGLQYYGECWSDENANGLYARAGESKACFHGIGGINAYSVYRLYI